MHDGYIFTLGVCGSASDSGPAPACLDAMLAALPPVKRAAYLGEVLMSESQPSLADPLTAPLLLDIADAEVLLVATPLPGGALPARLRALADALAAAPPPERRRFAAIVVFADGSTAPLWPLRHALEGAGVEVVGELYAPADAAPADAVAEAAALARAAYLRARYLHPEALE
jgi:hypothetical protein